MPTALRSRCNIHGTDANVTSRSNAPIANAPATSGDSAYTMSAPRRARVEMNTAVNFQRPESPATTRPSTTTVSFTGVAPDLFREGQGVVATGRFTPEGEFTARQLLAKHDENYQPRELKPLEAGG